MKTKLLLTGLVFISQIPQALACATCFGKSDSKMAAGMNMGIMTLLIVVFAIWVGLGAFAYYLLRRGGSAGSRSGSEMKADSAMSASINENDLVKNYQ